MERLQQGEAQWELTEAQKKALLLLFTLQANQQPEALWENFRKNHEVISYQELFDELLSIVYEY